MSKSNCCQGCGGYMTLPESIDAGRCAECRGKGKRGVDWKAEADSLRKQRDLLGECLRDCKRYVEDGTIAPSARMEMVRDRSTPLLMVWQSDVQGGAK